MLQPLAQPRGRFSNRRTCLHPVTPSVSLSFCLSLTVCFSLALALSPLPPSLPPSLNYTYSFFFFSSQVSSAALFRHTHRCLFQRSARDGITIKSHACKSSSAMMKRFVTIVLRGLVSLSKENPIWAKEHHRPPKKEIRRKRRAVKRAKTMGRRNLVRAVGISAVVSQLDHWSFCSLHIKLDLGLDSVLMYHYCDVGLYVPLDFRYRVME